MPRRSITLVWLICLAPLCAAIAAPLDIETRLGEPYRVLDRAAWRPTPAERSVLAIDLAGPSTTFDLLADFEGTSLLFRVRDAVTGEKLAVIKTETSNTSLAAEVYAWRLSVELGFSDIVVPAAPVRIEGAALAKLRDLIAGKRYDATVKERARQAVLYDLEAACESGGYLNGVIKPWMTGFMFHRGLGERKSLGEHSASEMLKITGPTPGEEDIRLRQNTRLYKPRGTYYGVIEERQLAADLSDIMLMDALMAQVDRFAGANLHFANPQGRARPGPLQKSTATWNLGRVRLLALDNGAAMRSRRGAGLRDLKGTIVRGTRVERFNRDTVRNLRVLWARLLAAHGETRGGVDSYQAAWWRLGIAPEEIPLAKRLMVEVLDYVSRQETMFGDQVWLPAVPDRGPDMPLDDPGIEDPFFAFVIGLIESDLVGAWDRDDIAGWIEATGRTTELPLEGVVRLERKPIPLGSADADEPHRLSCRLRLVLEESLSIPLPYSILGYHPGTLHVSEELVAEEWDLGSPHLFLHDEERVDQASAQGLRAMRLSRGWMVLDVDGWLDSLLGKKLDDTWVEAFVLSRVAPLPAGPDPVLEGMALGRSRSGRPLAGTFDFAANEVLPNGRPVARALSGYCRPVVAPREEPAESRAWTWPHGR